MQTTPLRHQSLVVRLVCALIHYIGTERTGCLELTLRYLLVNDTSGLLQLCLSMYFLRYKVQRLMTQFGLTWQHTTAYSALRRAVPISWTLPLTFHQNSWFLIAPRECRWQLLAWMGWHHWRPKPRLRNTQSGWPLKWVQYKKIFFDIKVTILSFRLIFT